jgi:hypothetical protein
MRRLRCGAASYPLRHRNKAGGDADHDYRDDKLQLLFARIITVNIKSQYATYFLTSIQTHVLISIVVPCMLLQSLLYCSNSCISLHFKTLKSQTKTLKICLYMFRSPLKPSSGGPWPYFARLLNCNVHLNRYKMCWYVAVCQLCVCVCVCVWVGGYLSGRDYA